MSIIQHFWVGFFLPKILSIFNNNNTCNKYIRINLNIKIKMYQTQTFNFFLYHHLKSVTN